MSLSLYISILSLKFSQLVAHSRVNLLMLRLLDAMCWRLRLGVASVFHHAVLPLFQITTLHTGVARFDHCCRKTEWLGARGKVASVRIKWLIAVEKSDIYDGVNR